MNATEGNHVTITYGHGKLGDQFTPMTIDIPCANPGYLESVASYFLDGSAPKSSIMTGKDFQSSVNSAYFTATLGQDNGKSVVIDPAQYYKIMLVEKHKA